MKMKRKARKCDPKVAQIIANAQRSLKGKTSAKLASGGQFLSTSTHICDVILPGI